MPPKKQPNVEELLRDCIAADPSLKGREDELRGIIQTLLASKPDTRFDEQFAARLRDTLMETKPTSAAANAAHKRPSWLMFGIPAGAFAAILLAVVVSMPGTAPTNESQVATSPDEGPAIRAVGSAAFGSLAATNGQSGDYGALGTTNAVSRNQSGGGGGGTMAMGVPAPAVMSEDAKMIAPGEPYVPTEYRFTYTGTDFELFDAVDVYRRVKPLGGANIANQLQRAAGGLADLTRLQNVKTGPFAIVEDREYGYIVNVDPNEGTVSFSQNWQRWPHPESQCRDEACWAQYRLNPSDVPANDAVIAVADEFIAQYGIGRDQYGTPEVNNQWRIAYDAAPLAARSSLMIYTPDVLTVTYPLQINGMIVVDDSGMPSGMTVNVNIRQMKVDSAWNISTTRYEQSSYAGVTDSDAFMKVLERGGMWYGPMDGAKIVNVEVTTGDMVLRRTWKGKDDGTSDDLFVPAIRFPVVKPPEGQEWRQYVVVPLAKELLEEQGGGIVMPLVTPSARPEMAPAESAPAPVAPPLQ